MHIAFMRTPESDRLALAREKAGYDNPTDAAAALGVKESTYYGHENGSRGFRAQADKYARRFGVNLDWLIEGRGPMSRRADRDDLSSEDVSAELTRPRSPEPRVRVSIPQVAWVNAGKLADIDTQLPTKKLALDLIGDLGGGDFFATRVEGDSMNLACPEKAILIVDRNDRQLVSGRYYIFAVDGKTTFKVFMDGDPPYLAPQSSNPHHAPIIIKRKRDVEIVGRVKRAVLDF